MAPCLGYLNDIESTLKHHYVCVWRQKDGHIYKKDIFNVYDILSIPFVLLGIKKLSPGQKKGKNVREEFTESSPLG